jgi:acetoacetate decarboxylase
MLLQARVFDAQPDSYDGKKGKVTQMMYILQDEPTEQGAPKLRQFVEFPQPDSAPQIGIGTLIQIDVTEVRNIFSGRPRIDGKIRVLTGTTPPPPKRA